MTFPGAGMYQQPSSVQAVGALPAARDEAASYQAHGEFLRGPDAEAPGYRRAGVAVRGWQCPGRNPAVTLRLA
jgi:hypothetical protein